ncbi:MAG: PEP-CTERM sorting domain-containing protein [Phycisphaerae bacterium]
MNRKYVIGVAATVMLCAVLAMPRTATAQNLLANPSFENGLAGWTTFGNVFAEVANPPQFVPHTGNGLVSMFGTFTGGFNVSGFFQEFPATPGSSWTLDSWSRHWSGDAIPGDGPGGPAPNDNWVVQKIAFKDAGGVEIGFAESIILDGTSPTDVWIDNAPITGVAPAGTATAGAFLLYLQPLFDGGAAHFDDVVFTPEPTSLACLGIGGLLLLRRRRRAH